ncbi:sensor histidine kinase [Rufibacter roseus]|uniref:histidine kinase n=1 Tax=Rufibacter roseus TaxID=1567108 RepID=A0ABW2DJU4_9BACT|nr:HAMP domain-containing sensor histidine kinase [Rufibacter roseus]
MKLHRTVSFYLLLATLLFGGVATFLQVSVKRDLLETPEKKMAQEVVGRINKKVSQAQSELNQIAQSLPPDSGFFSRILPKTNLPVFVYQQDKLIFWSDHNLRPEVDPRYLRRDLQVVENRFGRFLLIRKIAPPEYTLMAAIPLEKRYGITNAYLKSGLNPEIFENHAATLHIERSVGSIPIMGEGGQYLFSLRVLEPGQWLHAGKFTFVLFWLAITCWVMFLLSLRSQLIVAQKQGWALWAVIAGLLFLRLVMLWFQFPNNVYDVGLFSPRVYASSWWSPSLGDLLLNELCLLAIALLVFRFSKKLRFTPHFQKTGQKRSVVGLLLALAIMGIIISWYEFYRSLFNNTQPILDINQSIQFNWEKGLIYAVIAIHTVALSWIIRMLLSWLPFRPNGFKSFGVAWATALVIAIVYAFWRDAPSGNWIILFIGLVLVVWEKIHRKLKIRAGVYSSIFLLNILSASLGAAALYDLYAVQLREDKQRLAAQLLKDRDDITEYLLAQAAESIQKDEILQRVLRAPWVNLNFVEQKIRRHHLENLTENYAVVIRLFDVNGESLTYQDSLTNLRRYAAHWVPRSERTPQKDQLLINTDTDPGRFTYVQEVKIPVNLFQWITVMLELSPKIAAPNSVLPELLVERRSAKPDAMPSGSYALWKEGRWLKTDGFFEYSQYFSPQLFQIPLLYTQGLSHAGYHHLGTTSEKGTVAVVSTPAYGFGSWLSNFSFLFLLHTFALFGVLALLVISRGEFFQSIASTFSTKIQLFLNLGVLVPLVLVSITIGSLVTDSYKDDLIRGYTEQGQFIRQSLTSTTLNAGYRARPDSLVRRVNRLAILAQAELNVYDANGQLQIASQPALFEAGVLSTRMNPKAFSALKSQGLNRMLLHEKAGELPYSTLYLPLRSGVSQIPDGYLAIPFFDSEKDLNTKLIQLITTILNIFTVLFLLFVLLGYAATRALTVPLQLLTERLKRTTLTGSNEKLVYESRDEIGLLVREYNTMLQKLEESKQELALKEKEAAWKEMARQVAHEIKNPLTPMKLSLQYLRRAMQDGRSNLEELIDKISNTLITQIDVLSDIATSFSNFTSMPDLKLEVLELNKLVKQAADLHLNPRQHQINLTLPEEIVLVKADENQLIRIFNNLLLNALQAVPSPRTPEINIKVETTSSQWVLVSVRDNGSGIPEEVQPKIFVPNFSTKYTGSGIGLAVVKKGVEALGGSIWFETEENVGTTFFLKLPVVQT